MHSLTCSGEGGLSIGGSDEVVEGGQKVWEGKVVPIKTGLDRSLEGGHNAAKAREHEGVDTFTPVLWGKFLE